MSRRDSTLMREAQLVLDGDRRLGDLAQLAVDPEAHAVVELVGFEVQVGGAQIDRIDQHLLQEAHHRRVFHLGQFLRVVLLLGVLFGDVEIDVATAGHGLQRVGGAVGRADQHLGQLVLLDQHPVRLQLGGELDALHHLLVGGVGAAQDQAVAAPAQRHHLVLRRQLGVEQIARHALQVHRVEVHQRDRQHLRQRVRQLLGGQRAGRHRSGHEADLLLARLARQVLSVARRHATGIDQYARRAAQRGAGFSGRGFSLHGRQACTWRGL
jgi:hypothetical protein